jgi:hypothetical protein
VLHNLRHVGTFALTPNRAHNAQPIAGRKRYQVYDKQRKVAERELNSDPGQEQTRERQKQIHQRSREGNQRFLPVASAAGPSRVRTVKAEPKFVHRNAKRDGSRHVAHLMEQQAGDQHATRGQAKPETANRDFKQDAQGDHQPPRGVHAKWNQ